METFPTPQQPGWQDIDSQLIEQKITEGNFEDALFLCRLRKTALADVLGDIASVLEAGVSSEDEVTKEQWEENQVTIKNESQQLDTYITAITQKMKEDNT